MGKLYLKAAAITIVFVAVLVTLMYKFKLSNSEVEEGETRLDLVDYLEKNGLENFEFTSVKGKSYKIEMFKGKIVIINFWASWCAPCVEEFPSLIKLVSEFSGELILVAVSGDESSEEFERFVKLFPDLNNSSIYLVRDQSEKIMKDFGVERLPESLIFSRDLKLKKKIIGSIDWYNKDSILYLKNL